MPLQPLTPLGFPGASTLGRIAAPRPGPQVLEGQELTAEEEQSLLGRIMGGVQYVAETLDKPGSAVRGVLAGRPGQLANLVPFSGAAGLTDASERTSGRDLLEQYGLAAPNQPGLFNSPGDFAGDVGGFLLEVLLDPLWAVAGPLGAGSKAAKAGAKGAKAAEKALRAAVATGKGPGKAITPSTWAEGVRTGERAWASLRAPGPLQKLIPGEKLIGTGETAAKAAEWTTGLLFRNPASLGLRGLLSPPVKGAMDAATQMVRDRAWAEKAWLHNQFLDANEGIRAAELDVMEKLQPLVKHLGDTGDPEGVQMLTQLTREWREMLGDATPGAMAESMARYAKEDVDTVRSVVKVDLMADAANDWMRSMADMERLGKDTAHSLGMKISDLTDMFVRHAPRRVREHLATHFARGKKDTAQTLHEAFEFAFSRDNVWRHVPGGTATINRWSKDYLLNGVRPAGIKTVAEGAAEGIQPGVVVYVADRQNYGKVLSVSEDGTANVFFRNPETHAAKEVRLPAKQLTPQTYGAPEYLTNQVHYERMTDDEWMTSLKEEILKRNPDAEIASDASLRDLRKHYLVDLFREEVDKTGWMTRDELIALKGSADLTLKDNEKLLRSLDPQRPVESIAEREARLDRKLTRKERRAAEKDVRNQQFTKERFLKRFETEEVESLVDAAQNVTLKTKPSQADRMVDFFGKYGTDIAHGGLFDRRITQDHGSYMTSIMEHIANLRSLHKYMDDVFTKGKGRGIARMGAEGTEEWTPLAKVWAGTGRLDREGLRTFAKRHFPDAENVDELVGELVIHPRAAAPIQAYAEIGKPSTQNAIVKALDKVTAAYKGMLTVSGGPLWGVAFHTRNLASGMWQSWSDGKVDLKDLLGGYTAAAEHARLLGKGSVPAGKGLEHVNEFIENGGLKGHGMMVDILGEQAAEQAASTLPKGPVGGFFGTFLPRNVRRAVKERGVGALNPFSTRGVVSRPKSLLGESGEKGYQFVEFLNRAGYYEALRKKGHSIGESLEAVKRSQFDYGALSSFEKSVMRRAVPFWAWSKFNVPYQFAKIFEAPGGRAAQTYRAFNQGDRDEYVPSFLREGMAVRTGGDERNATFLKAAGIPVEDLNKLVFGGGVPTGRTLEKMAAQLHPLINLPIETFADKQFFTGRSRKQLRSTTGRLTEALTGTPRPSRLADSFIHYSPISRAAGELLGLIDKRKPGWQRAANALTGVKLSTYDAAMQRLIDLSKAMEEELKNAPYVREGGYFYVPEEVKPHAQAEQDQIRRIGSLHRSMRRLREEGVEVSR